MKNVIMNPPYSRNLHLKILNNVIENCPDAEIVNLSPVRWLLDPVVEYKRNTDFEKFENVRNHIEKLEEIDGQSAEKQFNIGLTFNLGIYYFTEKGGWKPKENKLLKKMIDKVLSTDSLKNHIVKDDLGGISLLISLLQGGRNGGLKHVYINGFNLPKEKAFYTNKINEITGETYAQYRKRTAWGACKFRSENTNIKFSTREERENFYNSYSTKCLKWMFGATMADVHVNQQLLPWLGDYTKPWTDDRLYKYFDLTEDEIRIIEEKITN